MHAISTVEIDFVGRSISLSGHIIFSIVDYFVDAWDVKDAISGDQEYPGGTAFKMVAKWEYPLHWNGAF